MKYLIITLLTFITLTSYSQGYKSRLETHRKQYKADFLTDKTPP